MLSGPGIGPLMLITAFLFHGKKLHNAVNHLSRVNLNKITTSKSSTDWTPTVFGAPARGQIQMERDFKRILSVGLVFITVISEGKQHTANEKHMFFL